MQLFLKMWLIFGMISSILFYRLAYDYIGNTTYSKMIRLTAHYKEYFARKLNMFLLYNDEWEERCRI